MTPLTLLLTFLLFSTLFFSLYHFLLSILPNSKPSSPPLIKSHPLIGNLLAYSANRHRLLHWYTTLLSSSQTLTLTLTLNARRTLITADPANVEHILKSNFPNYPKGPVFADILGDLLGSGIFASDGAHWLHQRKLASHHFSARSLRQNVLSSVQCATQRLLLPSLHSSAETKAHLDLQELLKKFTFDIICMISLGVDSAEVAQLGPAFEVAAAVSARRGAAPVFAVWKVKRVLNIGSEHKLRDAIRLIRTSIMEIIRKRRLELLQEVAEENKKSDVLSELIRGGHNNNAVIRDMVVSFLMAGRDTTSAALTWFFWLVSRHPEMEADLIQEIKEKDYEDYNGLKEMKLLEASLLETMRLYPPVVWDSKYAENDDVLPDGTRVKRGDRVTYFPYGMGRMERIWGKDWGEFRPARWTGEARKSCYEYPVFQAGPRVCLGKEMAFVQMKYVAAAVLERFELRRQEEEGSPEVVPLMTAHMAGGLNVVVRERD